MTCSQALAPAHNDIHNSVLVMPCHAGVRTRAAGHAQRWAVCDCTTAFLTPPVAPVRSAAIAGQRPPQGVSSFAAIWQLGRAWAPPSRGCSASLRRPWLLPRALLASSATACCVMPKAPWVREQKLGPAVSGAVVGSFVPQLCRRGCLKDRWRAPSRNSSVHCLPALAGLLRGTLKASTERAQKVQCGLDLVDCFSPPIFEFRAQDQGRYHAGGSESTDIPAGWPLQALNDNLRFSLAPAP